MSQANFEKVVKEFQKLQSIEDKISLYDEVKKYVMEEVERERVLLEEAADNLKKIIQTIA